MDNLLESACKYVSVLKQCRTEEVADWNEQDLKRALSWAQYFKNVKVLVNHSVLSTYGYYQSCTQAFLVLCRYMKR